jgi:hypothetical protein
MATFYKWSYSDSNFWFITFRNYFTSFFNFLLLLFLYMHSFKQRQFFCLALPVCWINNIFLHIIFTILEVRSWLIVISNSNLCLGALFCQYEFFSGFQESFFLFFIIQLAFLIFLNTKSYFLSYLLFYIYRIVL